MPAVVAERGIPQQYTEWKAPSTTLQTRPLVSSDMVHPVIDTGRIVDRRTERPANGEGTAAWIDYFDRNWEKEKLPKEWYNLKSEQSNKRVGFIMSRQMDLLKDPFDREQVMDWAQKTRRDLQGFKLEFLSDHNVYPRKYEIRHSTDPRVATRIEDPMYGKSKDQKYQHADIEEIVSEEERNGSVKRAMKKTKKFMATAPVGSMTVLTSPLGETGFKTDDGLGIKYPDSYFFLGVKVSETEMMNYTIKTNFNLKECRDVISRLTGTKLPGDAPLEAYADALAMIRPGEQERPQNVLDILQVLESVHPNVPFVDKQNGKVNSWNDVKDDIVHGEKLYNFDAQTTKIIDKFSEYAEADMFRTKLDYQKGIASTILLMGEHFFKPKQKGHNERHMVPNQWIKPIGMGSGHFGDILEQTAERRGCAGGGGSTTVSTAGGERVGIYGNDQEKGFSCSECSYSVPHGVRVGDTCPGCGFTKADYKKKYGDACE